MSGGEEGETGKREAEQGRKEGAAPHSFWRSRKEKSHLLAIARVSVQG